MSMFGMRVEPITNQQRAVIGADAFAFQRTLYVPQSFLDALRDLGGQGNLDALSRQVEWRNHWYVSPGDAWWER